VGCTAERANRHSGHSVPVHMHAGPWTLRTSNLAFVPHAAHSNNSLASPQAACLPLSSTNPFPNHNPPPKTLSTRRVTGTCQLSPTRRLASRKPNPEHPVGLPCPRFAFGPFRALSEAEEGPWPAWRPARRQGAPLHNPLVPNPNIAAPASSHACMPHRLWTPNQPPRGHDGLEHSPESQFLKLNVISTPRRGRAASSRRLRSLTA
jgi:hypothetical protein